LSSIAEPSHLLCLGSAADNVAREFIYVVQELLSNGAVAAALG
jgi:hypothetical protein